MSGLGTPDYLKARCMKFDEFNKLTTKEIIYSYIIIKGSFSFPKEVLYPSIPCYVDESTVVFPRSGDCLLTGAEYILAKNQKCKIGIQEIFYVPFVKKSYPFKGCINEVQRLRRLYPKMAIENRL